MIRILLPRGANLAALCPSPNSGDSLEHFLVVPSCFCLVKVYPKDKLVSARLVEGCLC